jgi:hypothetical protein
MALISQRKSKTAAMFTRGWLKIVVQFIRSIWKDIQPIITLYILPAIQIVNALKKALKEQGNEEAVILWLQQIFKDERKVIKALQVLHQALNTLNLLLDCGQEQTPAAAIRCFIQKAKTLPAYQQRALWRELAKQIALMQHQELQQHTPDQLDFAVQLAYSLHKNKRI